ncbi:MAG: UvrB/UvrC motif-containing protein [Phycisphaerales bacterium]|jgi:hypothetical protein|nr:UvrB/UvrC motif-containing protein [Phycisphaerales bacterium]
MHLDLTAFLQAWQHDPSGMDVRTIDTEGGRTVLQVRVSLGVLQMELDGRPDGGHPTALADISETTGELSPEQILRLREEIAQFDARIQALLMLGDPARAAQDGDHIRQIGLLLADRTHDDALAVQHLRRGITLRARAAAEAALTGKRTDLARLAIDDALRELRALIPAEACATANDIQLLEGMLELLIPRLPASQRVELESRLQDALRAENYELAAILRDELRLMR